MDLEEFFNKLKGKEIVIVGLGNRLRGDDAAGLLIIERINNPKFKTICAESGLENYIGKIIKLNPDIIFIVDAVILNEKAGCYKIFSSDFIQSSDILSHSLSFDIIRDLIESASSSKIYLLGIQPKTIGIGDEPTPEVLETVNLLVKTINSL